MQEPCSGSHGFCFVPSSNVLYSASALLPLIRKEGSGNRPLGASLARASVNSCFPLSSGTGESTSGETRGLTPLSPCHTAQEPNPLCKPRRGHLPTIHPSVETAQFLQCLPGSLSPTSDFHSVPRSFSHCLLSSAGLPHLGPSSRRPPAPGPLLSSPIHRGGGRRVPGTGARACELGGRRRAYVTGGIWLSSTKYLR